MDPYTSESYQESVEAARRLIGPLGGGRVFVSESPGAGATTLRIPPGPASSLQAAPSAAAPATPKAAAKPEPTPFAVAKPEPTAPKDDIAAEIAELRTSYQEARGRIEAFDDPVERDIGLATLRKEAAHTLGQLRSTGAGLDEEDLKPLSTYVSSLRGGQVSELGVKALDKAGTKVIRDLCNSLAALTLKGSLVLISGFAVWYWSTSTRLGAGAVAGILTASTGAVALGLRELPKLIKGAGETSERGLEWAGALGGQAEAAMSAPREIERRLWARCAGPAPWRHTPHATRVRRWALGLVLFLYFVIAVGALAFALGFVQAFSAPAEPSPGFGANLLAGFG